MTQLQKYTWLIETIRRAGKISHRDLSYKWEHCKDLSDCKPLHRATFNRWRDAIFSQFGIIIDCQRTGGYLYFIANPEDIDENELKKWMLDSFSVGNLIGENLSLKDRILVDQIPSGRDHLTTILEAMKENKVVVIEYRAFNYSQSYKIPVEPYCVKLHENRWYMLGHNLNKDTIRIYGLDRMESVEITQSEYKIPKDFSAADYFSASSSTRTPNRRKSLSEPMPTTRPTSTRCRCTTANTSLRITANTLTLNCILHPPMIL